MHEDICVCAYVRMYVYVRTLRAPKTPDFTPTYRDNSPFRYRDRWNPVTLKYEESFLEI